METTMKANYTIRPLDPVGGEVRGLLEGFEKDPEVAEALYAAWLQYGILLFRDIGSAPHHLAVSRCFGELEVHPLPELRAAEDPHFFPLGGDDVVAFVFDESDVRVNCIPWHRDTAFAPDICKGSMLRMIEVPPVGGETLLGDTAVAYDELPQDVKERLEGLEYRSTISLGVYDYGRPGRWWREARLARDEEYPEGMTPPPTDRWPDKSKYPSVVYPAVLTHPESGRKCIFLSPMNIDYFIGMPPAESKDLAEFLIDHMTSSRFVYRHQWSVNDAVLWDNRRFIHAAAGNKPGECRRGLRTTLADKMNAGRYFESGVLQKAS
jgi:taurine dioxygenase